VVLAVVAAVALGIGVQRHSRPTLEQRTMQLAGQVRCPVCQGQSAAQSDAPASVQIRDQIHQELAAGRQPSQILDQLVAAYGTGILEKPPARGVNLLVWVAPIVAAAAAVGGLAAGFVRWRRRPDGEVSASDRELVDEALGASSGGARPGGGVPGGGARPGEGVS
jgi:cytochrome c-type biogenesis protein CcmH